MPCLSWHLKVFPIFYEDRVLGTQHRLHKARRNQVGPCIGKANADQHLSQLHGTPAARLVLAGAIGGGEKNYSRGLVIAAGDFNAVPAAFLGPVERRIRSL